MITFLTLCQGGSGISTSLSCTSFVAISTHSWDQLQASLLEYWRPRRRWMPHVNTFSPTEPYVPLPPSPVNHLRCTAMWLPFVPGGTCWPGPAIPWVCKLSLWEEGLYPPAQVVVSPDSDYGPGGNEWQRTQILRKANDILQGICFQWGLCTVSTLGVGLLLLARRV